MTLNDILKVKGYSVHTVSALTTLGEVVTKLCKLRCGSLVVVQPDGSANGRMVGIITERDILHACNAHHGNIMELRVTEMMSMEIVTGFPSDTIEETMGTMTDHRIRHMPVVEDNRLIGIVSIGDVVKAQHGELTMENHYLKTYIHG